MGFLSNLFGRRNNGNAVPENKHAQNDNTQKEENLLYSNAPAHWPVITDAFIESNKNFALNYDGNKEEKMIRKRMFMNNSLVIIGMINKSFRENTKKEVTSSYSESLLGSTEQYATSFCIDKIFKSGIIKTNGIVIDNYSRYAVLLFDEPVSINYINKLKNLYLQDGYKDLIYYAVHDPESIEDQKEIEFESFTKTSFNLNKDQQSLNDLKHSEYAVWWKTAINEDFETSQVAADMARYLNLNANSSTYLMGQLSYGLGIAKDNTRVALPDYDEIIIEGPEGVQIIMSISNTTGINFHFPVSEVFENYRDAFIRMYVDFSETAQKFIRDNNYPVDDPALPIDWFNNLKKQVKLQGESFYSVSVRNQIGIHPIFN